MSRREVVVVGCGGHARVCLDILLADPGLHVVGCTAPHPPKSGLLQVEYLGDDAELGRPGRDRFTHAFVALGDNRLRCRKIAEATAHGLLLASAISRFSVVSTGACLGTAIAVMPGAVLNTGALVEDGAIVNTGATVDHDCHIGPGAHLAPGVILAGCVRVEEGVFMGTGSCAIPGVTIGAWSTVGAGAVVVDDVRAGSTVAGVPARVISESNTEAAQ